MFMYELGWIYYDMGDARQAIEYYEQALAIAEAVYGNRHHKRQHGSTASARQGMHWAIYNVQKNIFASFLLIF